MFAEHGYERRKVLGDACGLDVAALADGDIDAVEAQSGGRSGQFFALHKLEVLGEYRYLEFRLGLGRAAQQECTAASRARRDRDVAFAFTDL